MATDRAHVREPRHPPVEHPHGRRLQTPAEQAHAVNDPSVDKRGELQRGDQSGALFERAYNRDGLY